jgi:hypothetical protein
MWAYDVDGDGLNDVITSLDAHAFGLVWWKQQRDAAGKIGFEQNRIMGSRPTENPYGVNFSELHSVRLADINGDGLQDIVTGKTYWSHHRQSPKWDAGPVVYWFELRRGANGVEWIPHLADDQAGIGRQIVVADVDGNQTPDLVTGGMLGCHVLRHEAVELAIARCIPFLKEESKMLARANEVRTGIACTVQKLHDDSHRTDRKLVAARHGKPVAVERVGDVVILAEGPPGRRVLMEVIRHERRQSDGRALGNRVSDPPSESTIGEAASAKDTQTKHQR